MQSNSTMPAASRKLIDYTQQRATLLNNSQTSSLTKLPTETTARQQQLCNGHNSAPSLTTTTTQPASRTRSRQAPEAPIPTFHKKESSLPVATRGDDSNANEDNLVHFFLKVKRGDASGAARYSRSRSRSESPTRTIRDIILGANSTSSR